MDRREKLLAGLNLASGVGVEIGALDKPMLRRSEGEVIYVDFMNTDDLRTRYKNDPDVNVDKIVNVDAIWGAKTLQQAIGAERKVDYIVASHVIEHVPDLIAWLQELRSILNPQGQVRLMIPDRRYTFDYLRSETRTSDVINSYLHNARIPLSNCILDFLLNMGGVDCAEAWNGTLDAASIKQIYTFEGALSIARDAIENGVYHDVHCWVFTPKSFARLMGELVRMGFINLACERFCDSERYTVEFFVSLRSSDNREQMLKSWQNMAAAVSGNESEARTHEIAEQVMAESQQAKMAVLEKALSASEARVNSVCQELEKVRLDLAAEREQLARMEGSRSWKVTRPIRTLAETVRHRRGGTLNPNAIK